ncbi:MAG: hypothetical protein CL678_18620 [Bdellovibrionaceae bacterium]|nr:hypothetical protein [Pseudobdellovibrionaceae bacterium]|tara:strand:+ start:534 stop:1568 length:1035 start_codon:yes stop_codon:yes gene_type:complete
MVFFIKKISFVCCFLLSIDSHACVELFLIKGLEESAQKIELLSEVRKKLPQFILQSRSPEFEQLMDLSPEFLNQNISTFRSQKFTTNESIKKILHIFEKTPVDGDFYFIGNGFYIPYLIAKSIFHETPMASRIHFLAMSRSLARESFEDYQSFDRYFDFLKIGNLKNRKIVLIDSITEGGVSVGHSLIQISTAVRNYLLDKGWKTKDAMNVISVGIPESSSRFHPFRRTSLASYFKEMLGVRMRETDFPYFDVGLRWENPPFFMSYARELNWNGKYRRLGKDGFPIGSVEFEDFFQAFNLDEILNSLEHRMTLIRLYSSIVTEVISKRLLFKENRENLLLKMGI